MCFSLEKLTKEKQQEDTKCWEWKIVHEIVSLMKPGPVLAKNSNPFWFSPFISHPKFKMVSKKLRSYFVGFQLRSFSLSALGNWRKLLQFIVKLPGSYKQISHCIFDKSNLQTNLLKQKDPSEFCISGKISTISSPL